MIHMEWQLLWVMGFSLSNEMEFFVVSKNVVSFNI